MSSTPRSAQGQATCYQSVKEMEELSNHDLRAIIEQQEREIATLTEKLRSMSSANSSPSPQSAPLSGTSLHALQRGLTTADDIRAVGELCKQLVGVHWEHLQNVFFKQVERARDALPKRVLEWEDSLPKDWYKDAWYLLYVRDMGVEEGKEEGDFDSLRAVLPYLKRQGFRNVCVLPHYESPMADGGYDVSRYETRKSLGGEPAFSRFIDDAFTHEIRIATDGIFNHTSTEHEWFQRALNGLVYTIRDRYFVHDTTELIEFKERETHGELSRQMLMTHAGFDGGVELEDKNEEAVKYFLRTCQGLPLAFGIIERSVREYSLDCSPREHRWSEFQSAVEWRREDVMKTKAKSYGPIGMIVDSSLLVLEKRNGHGKFRSWFRALSVIQKQQSVPDKMLQKL